MSAAQAPALPVGRPATRRWPLGWLTNWWRSPWRKPRILETLTWLYLTWSIIPVFIAVVFSFNAGRSRSVWQGFSLRWYFTDPVASVWHDPTCTQPSSRAFAWRS